MPGFPFTHGLSSFGGADETTALEAFKALQGKGGYSEDPTSYRMREGAAGATVAATGAAAVMRAGDQCIPDTATEMLADLEHNAGLPNSAARTPNARKARLNALAIAAPRAGAIEAALALMGITATVLQNRAQNIKYITHGAYKYTAANTGVPYPDAAIYQKAVILSSPDYNDPVSRTAVLDILEKVSPMRELGHVDDPDITCMVAWQAGIVWGTDALDRCVFPQHDIKVASAPWNHKRPASRLKSYSALSMLRSRELNALQNALLWGYGTGSDTMRDANAGGEILAVSHVATAGSHAFDTSVDWRDRLVYFVGRISTQNINPGGAHDNNEPAGGVTDAVEGFTFTGPGGNSATLYRMTMGAGVGSGVYLFADTGNGNRLTVTNGGGSDLYLTGFLFATPKTGARTTVVPLTNVDTTRQGFKFTEGDYVPSSTFASNLVDRSHARLTSHTSFVGAGLPASVKGGIHRVGVQVTVGPFAGTPCNTYVLDSECDWRDRILHVSSSLFAETYPVFPGSDLDNEVPAYNAAACGYTGTGCTGTGGLVQPYGIELVSGTGVDVYADSTTGNLMLAVRQAASTLTAYLTVHATEQLGARGGTPPAMTIPTAPSADGDPVIPLDLNALQDAAILSAMRQGELSEAGKVDTLATLPAESDTWPLGVIGTGSTGAHGSAFAAAHVPSVWRKRPNSAILYQGASGRPASAATMQLRQKVAGGVRIFFAVLVNPNGGSGYAETLIDDSIDWKDRLIEVWAAYSNSDIRPSGTADNALNGATHVSGVGYVGWYANAAKPRGFVLKSTTGVVKLAITNNPVSSSLVDTLVLANYENSARYVVGMITASEKIGCRSHIGS